MVAATLAAMRNSKTAMNTTARFTNGTCQTTQSMCVWIQECPFPRTNQERGAAALNAAAASKAPSDLSQMVVRHDRAGIAVRPLPKPRHIRRGVDSEGRISPRSQRQIAIHHRDRRYLEAFPILGREVARAHTTSAPSIAANNSEFRV